MNSPLVSIIIVNWNAEKYIEKCIDSLLFQTYNNFEIILVDNDSSDNSVNIVKTKYPNVKIIQNNENLGFAEANNIGINFSSGELVALFNPDAVAEKNWLKILVTTLVNSNNIVGVAGKIYYLEEKFGKNTIFCTWSKIHPFSANPTNFHNDEPTSNVDYLSGAAVLLKREILEKIGLLDKNYFLYFEETDLCARILRTGNHLTYIPTAIAWHAVSPLSDSSNKIYYMERNKFRFALKNFDISYLPIFTLYYSGESLFIFLRDIKNFNLKRTKIRLRALWWNMTNFSNTLKDRRHDLGLIKKFYPLQSYNRSLPLCSIKAP